MGYRNTSNPTVEVEVTCPPQEVGRSYLIHVEHDKRGMPDVKHYIPISLVSEVHDEFIVVQKWKAVELGLRF